MKASGLNGEPIWHLLRRYDVKPTPRQLAEAFVKVEADADRPETPNIEECKAAATETGIPVKQSKGKGKHAMIEHAEEARNAKSVKFDTGDAVPNVSRKMDRFLRWRNVSDNLVNEDNLDSTAASIKIRRIKVELPYQTSRKAKTIRVDPRFSKVKTIYRCLSLCHTKLKFKCTRAKSRSSKVRAIYP